MHLESLGPGGLQGSKQSAGVIVSGIQDLGCLEKGDKELGDAQDVKMYCAQTACYPHRCKQYHET